MKKIILISIILIILILISIVYTNDMQMNECLELRVPILTKRETIELQTQDFFNDEKVVKIYLSKNQIEDMLKKIKKNNNWKNTELDKSLDEKMNANTRKEIYNQIPNIGNAYWIFTNRSNGINDVHSVDEMLNDMYYAISFGILDIDNRILYYYEYDR